MATETSRRSFLKALGGLALPLGFIGAFVEKSSPPPAAAMPTGGPGRWEQGVSAVGRERERIHSQLMERPTFLAVRNLDLNHSITLSDECQNILKLRPGEGGTISWNGFSGAAYAKATGRDCLMQYLVSFD